jgi:streptogramin lyase
LRLAILAAAGVAGAAPGVATASGPVIQSFALPAAVSGSIGAMQDGITEGPDGQEWFAVNPGEPEDEYRLVEVNAAGAFTVLPADLGSTGEETGIGELSPDGGTVWALAKGDQVIGINASGQLDGSAVAIGAQEIFDMTVGPDGDLYLTQDAARIDRIVPGQGTFTTIQAPVTTEPDEIVDAAGRMFFADDAEGGLDSLTTDGTFSSDDVTVGTRVHAMVAGPDGDVWAVSHGVDGNPGTSLERIDPATGALLGTYTTPQSLYLISIAAGADGRLWFPEAGLVHAIGAFDPSTSTFSTYALPANFDVTVAQTQNADNNPPVTDDSTIALGANGTLWVTGKTSDGAPAIAEISGLSNTTGTAAPGSGPATGTPTQSPGAPVTTHRASIRVAGHVSARGVLAARVTCTGHGTCRGQLRITHVLTTTVHRAGRRTAHHRTLTMAAARYSVTAGHHLALRLRLSRRAMRLIESAPRRRLSVTLQTVSSGRTTQSASLVLRAPRAAATRRR